MEEKKILELYENRSEEAITQTKAKYGAYCLSIAMRILQNREDACECENDTYMKAWNTIPPKKPSPLSSYLGTITRTLSLDRLRRKNAMKRSELVWVSFEELEECIPSDKYIQEELEAKELAEYISIFLQSLPKHEVNVFLNRYWYFLSIKEISEKYEFTQSKVKMMLSRTRSKLSDYLSKEGIFI